VFYFSAVSAESVNSLKSKLDKFWSMHDLYMTIQPIRLLSDVV